MSAPTELPIPDHWTPEQAAAVHELLEMLQAAVWSAHGAAIARLYEAETVRRDEQRLDLEELLPF